jgi:hypothetical protein
MVTDTKELKFSTSEKVIRFLLLEPSSWRDLCHQHLKGKLCALCHRAKHSSVGGKRSIGPYQVILEEPGTLF